MTEFPLVIRTPDRECFSGPAEGITVPALNGELGVLAGHLPLLAGLKAGVVHVRTPGGGERWFAVDGGILGVERGSPVRLLAMQIADCASATAARAAAAGFQNEAAPAAP
ncbi:MAG TPA: hypothetical protein PLT37_07230 [Kiritimatiellia bacterium]|nr:hypothetical protein [Kiritimatiellia bacterium]HOR75111.1 hypothetical protein [Kiritimatiellia bacterium]HQF21018.1 hypothetical protein [Kiritimatiellia bacterium]HQG75038.1 hypothetical protein [Kiritimatiellia bacterium]HXK79771.1 hypothetical protein [Kiritimatiellia bacterium]